MFNKFAFFIRVIWTAVVTIALNSFERVTFPGYRASAFSGYGEVTKTGSVFALFPTPCAVKMTRDDCTSIAMTIQEFARQTYWYPILWFVFATGVAFGAALLFWKRGSATAGGQVPGVPVSWKFGGASAIFVVVLLIFFLINPVKPFSDYKSVLILCSNQQQLPSPTDATLFTIDRSTISVDDEDIPFDKNTLQIQMTPADFTYDLRPQLTGNSFGTNKAIPKGIYTVWFISSATGKAKYFQMEVK